MPDPPDLLARAYATLELPPGASRREATRRYKRLVRRWHPDQYSNDSQGQAEAAQRMREINRAFAVVRQSWCPDAGFFVRHREKEEDPAPQPRSRFFGQRLSAEEIREISNAIGTAGVFGTLVRYFFWGGSLAYGYLLAFQPTILPRGTANVVAGIALICTAVLHWIYTVCFKERQGM